MNQPHLFPTAFEDYHKENPHVYQAFERFTFEAIRSGRLHLGSKAVMERIRWDSMVTSKSDEFKVNNNFTPHYARLFEKNHPEYEGFFFKRKSKADKEIG